MQCWWQAENTFRDANHLLCHGNRLLLFLFHIFLKVTLKDLINSILFLPTLPITLPTTCGDIVILCSATNGSISTSSQATPHQHKLTGHTPSAQAHRPHPISTSSQATPHQHKLTGHTPSAQAHRPHPISTNSQATPHQHKTTNHTLPLPEMSESKARTLPLLGCGVSNTHPESYGVQ